MKLGESREFRDLCRLVLDYYDKWDEESDIPAPTDRACIMGGNRGNTTCFVIFKGNREDCLAIRKFLERRDKKK